MKDIEIINIINGKIELTKMRLNSKRTPQIEKKFYKGELEYLESVKTKLEANEILSRAIEFEDEGDFQSGHLHRVIFNDMVDSKEKAILEKAFKGE